MKFIAQFRQKQCPNYYAMHLYIIYQIKKHAPAKMHFVSERAAVFHTRELLLLRRLNPAYGKTYSPVLQDENGTLVAVGWDITDLTNASRLRMKSAEPSILQVFPDLLKIKAKV